jgi:Pyruvate/2-oxoacid:ferredoxin oxidoreductase delta subunit
MSDPRPIRRIDVRRRIVGPPAPRPHTATARTESDYPGVPRPLLHLARKISSPLLIGPPLCDELVAFVQHAFTEEEASLAGCLDLIPARSAAEVARSAHRPVSEVTPVLEHLARGKFVILADGTPEAPTYRLLPVAPGMFELVLIGQDPDALTPWHRRFAELFEALFETGYFLDYTRWPTPALRYLPLEQVTTTNAMAVPADRLESTLAQFDHFAVGPCQCRMTARVGGHDCGKPLGNCLIMGDWAERLVALGRAKPTSRQGALEVKREAESHGLVTFLMNLEGARVQVSCSCCGCCCHAMRLVREWSAPALAAPPHFTPRFDDARCTHCGKCATACPMGALGVDLTSKQRWMLRERCIGCGLCVLACDRAKAVTLEPAPGYRETPQGWLGLLRRAGPVALANAARAWLRH